MIYKAANIVQTFRDLWKEIKEDGLSWSDEEALDYLKRWMSAAKEADQCELTPTQKNLIMNLNTIIGEYGSGDFGIGRPIDY